MRWKRASASSTGPSERSRRAGCRTRPWLATPAGEPRSADGRRDTARSPEWTRSRAASPVAVALYMLGQFALLCLVEELEEEEDCEDGVAKALPVAAFAMAVPPPTSIPERTRAARARFIRIAMWVHLLFWCARCPVKRLALRGCWD